MAYVTDDEDPTSAEPEDAAGTGQPAGDLGERASRAVPPVLVELAARLNVVSENAARTMIENITRGVSPAFAAIRADVLRSSLAEAQLMRAVRIGDALTPAVLRGIQMDSGAALSKIVLSGSAFSGWRSALATQNMVASWAKNQNFVSQVAISPRFLEELREVTRINVRLSEVLANLHPAHSALAVRPLGAYQSYLGQLPTTLTRRQQVVSRAAGHGINGLLATGVLLEVGPDADVETLVPLVNRDVVEAWTAGPAAVRTELYERLGNLESSVPELLEGAWHDVVHPAPARLVTIATCAVEAIDRSLRAAAPDSDVETWIPTSGRKSGLLCQVRQPDASSAHTVCLADTQGRSPARGGAGHGAHRQLHDDRQTFGGCQARLRRRCCGGAVLPVVCRGASRSAVPCGVGASGSCPGRRCPPSDSAPGGCVEGPGSVVLHLQVPPHRREYRITSVRCPRLW